MCYSLENPKLNIRFNSHIVKSMIITLCTPLDLGNYLRGLNIKLLYCRLKSVIIGIIFGDRFSHHK